MIYKCCTGVKIRRLFPDSLIKNTKLLQQIQFFCIIKELKLKWTRLQTTKNDQFCSILVFLCCSF